jgi:hypothetical protein
VFLYITYIGIAFTVVGAIYLTYQLGVFAWKCYDKIVTVQFAFASPIRDPKKYLKPTIKDLLKSLGIFLWTMIFLALGTYLSLDRALNMLFRTVVYISSAVVVVLSSLAMLIALLGFVLPMSLMDPNEKKKT